MSIRKKKNIFIIFILLILIFIAYGNSNSDIFLEKINNYLNSQYIEEARLLKASTISKPDSKRIYIASDNLLASYALSLLSCPLGEIVKKELEKYNKGFDELHEVILGVKIPDEFYARKNEYVGLVFSHKFGPIEIFYEKPDKNRVINDWYNYADLIVYKALNYLLDGKVKEAVGIYEKLMRMWDGWGFRDIVAVKSGSYETYKVALGLLLLQKLKKIDRKITENYQETIEKMKKIILSLQDENGGIITDYTVQDDKIIPLGDSNTETSSIVVISFLGEKSNDELLTEVHNLRQRKIPSYLLAFYYAWYGTPKGPMGNGKWIHWYSYGYYMAKNYPLKGLYDSWDEKVIKEHILEAIEAGIDGFIVSWWGPGSYESDTVIKILRIIEDIKKENKKFYVTIYYEGYEGKATVKNIIDDLTFALEEFSNKDGFLKIDNKPIIFIYSRAVNNIPKNQWEIVLKEVRKKCGDVLFIVDSTDIDFVKIFGGIHIYNICGLRTYSQMENFLRDIDAKAKKENIIHAMDISPGYDDTYVRKPGFIVDRENGKLYEKLWNLVLELNPDMVIITSWNEWHEGSEIEPSIEEGNKYLELTKKWSSLWKEK